VGEGSLCATAVAVTPAVTAPASANAVRRVRGFIIGLQLVSCGTTVSLAGICEGGVKAS
jgi:hypothetical protein